MGGYPSGAEERVGPAGRQGQQAEFYDSDFWLTEKDGKRRSPRCGSTRSRSSRDTVWVQVPRYSFEKEKVQDLK